MNALISRGTQRSLARNAGQKRWSHGDDMPIEEAMSTLSNKILTQEAEAGDCARLFRLHLFASQSPLTVFLSINKTI